MDVTEDVRLNENNAIIDHLEAVRGHVYGMRLRYIGRRTLPSAH